MKTTRCVLIAAIVGLASDVFAAERPTAEELLAAFEKSVERLARLRIEWSINLPETKQPDGRLIAGGDNYIIFRDGPRWKIDRSIRTTTVENGDRSENRVREQALIGDEIIRVTQFYHAPDDLPGTPIVHAWRGEHAEKQVWAAMDQCRVVFARMDGDSYQPLWTVMREATTLELLPQTETVAGVETYVLRSRGKYGEHQVWLDPASGGLPRRIEVKKRPGHLFNDEQLGATPVPDAEAEDALRRQGLPRPRRETSSRIDNIQIEGKDGIYAIAGFVEELSIIYTIGVKQDRRREVKFRVGTAPKEFPEDAFRLQIAISNGTRVYVTENGRDLVTRFEWVDGKIRERVGK